MSRSKELWDNPGIVCLASWRFPCLLSVILWATESFLFANLKNITSFPWERHFSISHLPSHLTGVRIDECINPPLSVSLKASLLLCFSLIASPFNRQRTRDNRGSSEKSLASRYEKRKIGRQIVKRTRERNGCRCGLCLFFEIWKILSFPFQFCAFLSSFSLLLLCYARGGGREVNSVTSASLRRLFNSWLLITSSQSLLPVTSCGNWLVTWFLTSLSFAWRENWKYNWYNFLMWESLLPLLFLSIFTHVDVYYPVMCCMLGCCISSCCIAGLNHVFPFDSFPLHPFQKMFFFPPIFHR